MEGNGLLWSVALLMGLLALAGPDGKGGWGWKMEEMAEELEWTVQRTLAQLQRGWRGVRSLRKRSGHPK